jgi:hypothetical protein
VGYRRPLVTVGCLDVIGGVLVHGSSMRFDCFRRA